MREPRNDPGANGRDETELERVDRNMIELLNELRVALPGVQVLFAFLLVLPFSQGFTSVTDFQKVIYLATLLATALSAVLLIAPSMHHRIEFRKGTKPEIVRDANRLAITGMSALAVAMIGAVMLVTDYVFSGSTMAAVVAGLAATFVVVWYAIPAWRLIKKHRDDRVG